jgi:hypothetical protein
MVRVRYRPVPDRIETFSVYLVDQVDWHLGFISQTEQGSWAARRRGDTQIQVVGGWPRRFDAATWLAIRGGFCKRPAAAPMQAAV